MDPATLLHWDRHLVTCASCRHAVAEERRVLDSLRSPAAAAVPGDLRGMLLALGAQGPGTGADDRPGATGVTGPLLVHDAGSARRRGTRPFVPPVPVAPVPVVDRGTPAMHRSARRATVFAGLAAGATAAAAWSLAVTGSAAPSSSPSVSPGLVQGARPASSGVANASFTVPNLGLSTMGVSTVPGSVARPALGGLRGQPAESTP